MAKDKTEKTNVMRILDQKKVPYGSYSYADTDAISGVEVASALVVINLRRYFVHSRQRMEYFQRFLRIFKLVRCQNIAVSQAEIIVFVEETFLLYPCHVQNIDIRHSRNKICGFGILHSVFLDDFLFNVSGKLQLIRRDKHKLYSGITRKR